MAQEARNVDVELEEIQTATIRQKQAGNTGWSPIISATKAIKKAGLNDSETLYFDPAQTQRGLVPTLGKDAEQRIGRTLLEVGGGTLRVLLPDEVLEKLEIPRDEIDSDDPPEVTIYAGIDEDGDGVIALEKSGKETLTIQKTSNGSA